MQADDIKFGFGFYTKDIKQFDDPAYFTWKINKFIIDKRKGFSLTTPKLEYDFCKNIPKFFDTPKYNYTDLAKANQMDNFICLKNLNTSTEGSFSRDYFENLQIKMLRCKNSTTSNVICKSDNEINDKLQGSFFEFYYTNRYIEVRDFQDPMKEFFDVYFIALDPYSSRFVDMYLKRVNITSDEGVIFEEKVTKEYVNFDYVREQFDTKAAETQIISFFINSSNNVLDVNRSYFKLTDMAAIVGGIFNVCIVIGQMLAKFISEVQIKIQILNTLFFFDTDRTEDLELIPNSPDKFIGKRKSIDVRREEAVLKNLKLDFESNFGQSYKKKDNDNPNNPNIQNFNDDSDNNHGIQDSNNDNHHENTEYKKKNSNSLFSNISIVYL